jgi:diguanylate cyclase (GGDEF)-like protein
VTEPSRSARVLVVDDEDLLRRHTQRHLQRSGYTCDAAADAAEARVLLARESYEVVLCDVRMPGESGLDLIDHITTAHPDTSTVMISGVDDTETAERALRLGAVGYVVKPFERNELLINISNALHRREMKLENRRQQERLEELIELQANFDLLTGLGNRQLLTRQLEDRLDAAPGRPVAVLFLDLDHFKVVNDSLGHDAGDHILREVAARLRQVAGPDDLLARFGGDKFVLVLDPVVDAREAVDLAERILDVLRLPHEVRSRVLVVGASVGIVIVDPERDDAQTALRDADAAMYQAKALGRDAYKIADDATRVQARKRLDTEQDLRAALDEGQLRVHYQPKYALDSTMIVGFEALVRWHHPVLGQVLPGEFIPIAEETGLIVPLGAWVLEQACRDLTAFRGVSAACSELEVSVNVSAVQLSRGDLSHDVEQALSATPLPAEALVLELTESILVEGISPTLESLKSLKTVGVRLSIDDFGTGYSSLSYIGRLPIDEVKIDRSFIVDLVNHEGTALVAGIIGLAQAIGHTVVAEGIETVEQLDALRGHGCDQAQGYLLGRPQTADDILALLERGLTAQLDLT